MFLHELGCGCNCEGGQGSKQSESTDVDRGTESLEV